MRRVWGAGITALVTSACLSSANLSGTPPPDVCEADVQNDPANCGACGNVCVNRANAYGTCTNGGCTIGCNTGFADCNGDIADGCEVSLASDGTNCGACAYDCGGGRCESSICQPFGLAALPDGEPTSIAVDDQFVFVGFDPALGTDNNTIVRLSKQGTQPQDLVGALVDPAEQIALDATHVFYLQKGTTVDPIADGVIRKVPKTGGASSLVIGAQAFSTTFSSTVQYGRGGGTFALADDFLYWLTASTTMSGGPPNANGRLRRCSAKGTCIAADVATGLRSPEMVAIDGATAYFSANGDFLASVYEGRGVYRCAGAGCGATPTRLTQDGFANHLAFDGDNVFVAVSNTILRVPKSGGPPAPFANSRGTVRGMVVLDGRLYWLDLGGDALLSCPLAGCNGPPTEISLNADPVAIAKDDNAVYVAASSGSVGVVLRIAKVSK